MALLQIIHPTPWVYDDNREGFEGLVAVFDAEGNHIMSFGDMEDCTGQDIGEAMLFAAAPELLEALEALVSNPMIMGNAAGMRDLCTKLDIPNPLALARAAIAKARGE